MIIKNGWKTRHTPRNQFKFWGCYSLLQFCPIYIVLFGRGFVPFGYDFKFCVRENKRKKLITVFNIDFYLKGTAIGWVK